MGKLLQGVNGPFSGKVGTAVGYMWKDVPVIRARPRRRRKPFSEKELNQQARFALMNEFLAPVKDLLNISFAHLAYRMTGFNKGFSYNVKAAILGIRPDLSIDYPTVLLSRGDLTKAESTAVLFSEPGLLQFTWTDNSGKGKASGTDKVFVAVYNAETGYWQNKLDLATRADSKCELKFLSEHYTRKPLHVYLGFMAADGKDASDSVYLGPVDLQPN
jgi:hypothetical protein